MIYNNNSNKYIYKALNIIICVILGVLLMAYVSVQWSKNGEYTIYSFITSLFIHGSPFVIVGFLINEWIKKHFDD